MNVTSLEQFHQSKSHDETDGGPFEASQSCLKHHADASAGKSDAQAGVAPIALLMEGRRSRQDVTTLWSPIIRGNALTANLLVVYARRYDYQISCSRFCNRTCERLRCASSVSHPGRITCPIAFTGKTTHT